MWTVWIKNATASTRYRIGLSQKEAERVAEKLAAKGIDIHCSEKLVLTNRNHSRESAAV